MARWLWLLVALGCAGAVETVDGDAGAPPGVDSGTEPVESADAAASDADCGLSLHEAEAAFAPGRVCQSTEYRLDSGYCTHWVPCSSF